MTTSIIFFFVTVIFVFRKEIPTSTLISFYRILLRRKVFKTCSKAVDIWQRSIQIRSERSKDLSQFYSDLIEVNILISNNKME